MYSLLSFDYELFGSGKGCVFSNLIEPTNRILKVLKERNIKATFFIEVLEVEAIIALKDKYGEDSYEYKAALALEQQIDDMVFAGHDLQLHLHPQWLNANYDAGQWVLNYDWWRFSAFPDDKSEIDVPSKSELIRLGVNYLEKRIRRVKSDYKCHSFRAGGYNLGEEKSSVSALVENGIRIDSSVCHGFFSNAPLSQFDYTSTNFKKSKWFSRETILEGSDTLLSPEQCMEIPLIAVRSGRLERLSLARFYNYFRNRKLKGISYFSEISVKSPTRAELQTNSNFDVCLSSSLQVKRFCSLIRDNSYEYTVLIGHPKDYSLFSPFRKIITMLGENTSFVTFDQVYKQVFQ